MMDTEPPKVEQTPVRWRILAEWCPIYGHISGGIYVEERRNREHRVSYAIVLRDTWELSKSGDWDDQPIPSDRDAEYLGNHRWTSLTNAFIVVKKAARKMLMCEGGAKAGD